MIDLSQALDLGREALIVSLIIAGPILLTGVVVGLFISLIQTVTQLQDQTFALVPKIVAMFAAAIIFVPWLANRLIEYAQDLFTST